LFFLKGILYEKFGYILNITNRKIKGELMMLYILTFIIIICLILTNAITDAPNAIATLVGTKVMPFRKAANLSAIFNLIGIVVMSFINISVANCISSIVNLNGDEKGIIVLISGMVAVILFAVIAMKFGIPTSETHGLVAGFTGAGIAIYGFNSINIDEWKNVIIGLFWSVLGTFIVGYMICKIFEKIIIIREKEKIEKWQILGCCGMSFMHGAQDGQKFIGILIIFFSLVKNISISEIINPLENIWIIIYTAFIMAMGVSIGGKKIVDNIGSEMVELDNKQALMSDITTMFTLFIASMTGIPVSTTHAKTMSIIAIGKNKNSKIDKSRVVNICKAWFLNFPISGGIGYILAIILNNL